MLVEQDFSSGGPLGLSGTFEAVTINARTLLQLSKGSVSALSIGAGAGQSTLAMTAGTRITRAVLDAFAKVTGTGLIETVVLNAGAKGSTFENKPITVEGPQKDSLILTAPVATPSPAGVTGGGSGATAI
ncbi:hypothetical protein D3C73_926170 [compost metagenome]